MFRKMRGMSKKAKAPEIQGLFCMLSGLPRQLDILSVEKGETIIEQFYEDSEGVFHQ
jgi:hypothetical protein